MNGCIADTHLSSLDPESMSLFPLKLAESPPEQRQTLYRKLAEEINQIFRLTISCIQEKHGRLKRLVHLGEMTGGWQERGISHGSIIEQAISCANTLRQIADERYYCAGNHDTGYPGPVPDSGINVEALYHCLDIFGHLWWKCEEDGVRWIGVCSPLAEYQGADPMIKKEQKRQREFIGDTLAENGDSPWMLFSHSPFVGLHLAREIAPYLRHCQCLMHGDLHSPEKARLMLAGVRLLSPALRFAGKCKRVMAALIGKSICCPSVAPLWYEGCRYLVFENSPNPSAIRTEICEQAREIAHGLPTSSFWRGFLWRFTIPA